MPKGRLAEVRKKNRRLAVSIRGFTQSTGCFSSLCISVSFRANIAFTHRVSAYQHASACGNVVYEQYPSSKYASTFSRT